MPLNKVHDILDDAVTKPYVDKAHLTRIGLMLNTVDKSKPIPMTEDDRVKMLALPTIDNVLSIQNARDIGPFVLQFDGKRDEAGRFVIAILVVPMAEVPQIHCYPYSNLNKENKMWPYDKHFVISNVGDMKNLMITPRDTHPLAAGEDLDEAGMDHMSALAATVIKFLTAVQQGSITLAKEDKDYSKLNRKRATSKKSPIKPDYLLEWK